MTDITSIPLNKLVASEDNVRKTAGASLRRRSLSSHFTNAINAPFTPTLLVCCWSDFALDFVSVGVS
jgi:hypothetical protein